jgi:DNA polymerase/3'-5' exonuclease PolX
MELENALAIAKDWKNLLDPDSLRIEIVGSTRRCRPDVKDIELLLIPREETVNDMFGSPIETFYPLEDTLGDLWVSGRFEYVKDGPKYKKLKLCEGVIRTGPAALSGRCVTQRNKRTRAYDGISYPGILPSWARVKDGWKVYRSNGQVIPMPEEQNFLDFLGLGWVDPSMRTPDLNFTC